MLTVKTVFMVLFLIAPDLDYRYDINRIIRFYNTNTEYTETEILYSSNMNLYKFRENFFYITVTKKFPDDKRQTLTIYFDMEYESNNRITTTGIY